MNIVLLGPPGAGKGTQAKNIAEKNHLVHLSTGDLFRDAISHSTPLGIEIKNLVQNGRLVPDDLVSKVVFEKISSLKSGFLLDGYPRTIAQAKTLEDYSATHNLPIDFILLFDVSFPELVKRLSSRRQCPKCKQVYNLVQHPPLKENTCDRCSAELFQRHDDEPSVVEERLEIYTQQTRPLLWFYAKHPGFHKINGAQPIDAVFAEIGRIFASAGK